MVYIMEFEVDGGCRGNGRPGAYGAAAALLIKRNGRYNTFARALYSDEIRLPTNQRAEITAIILALETALDQYDRLDRNPALAVTIRTDSRYAIGCMTDWIYKWSQNGWINAKGQEVVNRDLIAKASQLDDCVSELGTVTYQWIPRADNQDADNAVNEAMDQMQTAMEEEMEKEKREKERRVRTFVVESDSDSDSDYGYYDYSYYENGYYVY